MSTPIAPMWGMPHDSSHKIHFIGTVGMVDVWRTGALYLFNFGSGCFSYWYNVTEFPTFDPSKSQSPTEITFVTHPLYHELVAYCQAHHNLIS